MGSHTEVTQHGVGFPAAEKLDDVGVDTRAEEGGGPTGAKAPGADEARGNAGGRGEAGGGTPKGGGDETWGDALRAAGDVVVGVDGGTWRGPMVAKVGADAQEGLDRAEARMGSGEMAELLASYAVLLVGKRKGGPQDAAYVHVIQRRVEGKESALGSLEGNVAKLEGLGAASAGAGEILGGTEQPEESNDTEVDGVLQAPTVRWVRVVEEGVHVVNDGGVDGVCTLCGVVLVQEGLEETSQ